MNATLRKLVSIIVGMAIVALGVYAVVAWANRRPTVEESLNAMFEKNDPKQVQQIEDRFQETMEHLKSIGK